MLNPKHIAMMIILDALKYPNVPEELKAKLDASLEEKGFQDLIKGKENYESACKGYEDSKSKTKQVL